MPKLHECRISGPGSDCELFIVEGDSASKTVVRSRQIENQAVLPMQGKPLNAWKASRSAVARNGLFQALISALGAGWDDACDLALLRYRRVILLFDPDADGIHCGALMSMFFYRWMRPLLENGSVHLVRPPWYEIRLGEDQQRLHAYSEAHYHQLRKNLQSSNRRFQSQRYRGLASIDESILVASCLNPSTRQLCPLTLADAQAAIAAFSGAAPRRPKSPPTA